MVQKSKKNKALVNIKNIKSNYTHILVIILCSVFILLPCFHKNLWFDESYSVAIARHPISELWEIGSHDVHPVLYYIIIRIVWLITNGSIIWIRIFSAVPLIIMSILGYTHVRKDFGDRVGILFSFFSCILPTCLVYSSEVRMYTWAMLFITLMFIYAYKILKYRNVSNKNWILFSIFSICSAYIHYYGLAAAFVVNLFMFITLSIKAFKSRKINESRHKRNLKRWAIFAILQIISYLPWFDAVMIQIRGIKNSFWIPAPNLKTILEIVEFQFTGNLGNNIYVPKVLSIPFATLFLIYIIYLFKKNWHRDEIKPAKLAILIYLLIILFIGLISILKPILYARYFMTITGIFIFVICILLAREKPARILFICFITLIISLTANINLINENYDNSNNEPLEYILDNKNENDIFLVNNDISGFQLPLELNVNSENIYFYDKDNWNVEEAYKAFGKTIHKLSELDNYKGNIFAISLTNELSDEVVGNLENSKLEKRENFETKYKDYKYVIAIIEKE